MSKIIIIDLLLFVLFDGTFDMELLLNLKPPLGLKNCTVMGEHFASPREEQQVKSGLQAKIFL